MVFRPGDANETVEAWRAAIRRTDGPTVLALTRQKLPVLDRGALGAASGVQRGGYVLFDPPGGAQAIIVATGSELSRGARRGARSSAPTASARGW